MRWGLVPYWAEDASVGDKMINARSETAAEKPAFRESLQRCRCLIPADGFYEWPRRIKAKQAFYFGLSDDSLFAFAGLWDRWRAPDGTTLETCTILTTTPNQLLADVHDRMPVILPPTSYDLWLDPRFRDSAATTEMLKPYDAGRMRRYAVSTRVNSVTNDDSECSESTEVSGPMQTALF